MTMLCGGGGVSRMGKPFCGLEKVNPLSEHSRLRKNCSWGAASSQNKVCASGKTCDLAVIN